MIKTAESVTPKHPDKLCDRISDSILDAYLEVDPNARVAVESMGGHGIVTISGEVTSTADIDVEKAIKSVVGEGLKLNIILSKQSPEIANGVDTGGAGDQGVMVGYATSENESLIPNELYYARNLGKLIYQSHEFDGKTQTTVTNDGKISAVVASFQNTKAEDLIEIIKNWKYAHLFVEDVKIFCNPCGDWNMGGFDADSGVTGRKLAIDNYGTTIPIGGGAFSGKDPSKVDRSGAYMARKIAVDYLHKKGAEKVFCYLAYSIGVREPVQATVIIDGVEEKVRGYDLSPKAIIEFLNLKSPQYSKTAEWGHFGNGFKWDLAG